MLAEIGSSEENAFVIDLLKSRGGQFKEAVMELYLTSRSPDTSGETLGCNNHDYIGLHACFFLRAKQ